MAKLKILFFSLKLYKLHGQSLIEILVAIGLASVLLPAILTGMVASRAGKAQEGQRLEAMALLKGTEEAARSAFERDWNGFAVNNTYHPVIDGSNRWSLALGADEANGYSRQLTISDVLRDSNFNIVTSGGTVDPSTKKVDISVSWNTPRVSSVSTSLFLERHVGNAAKIQTTQADFNSGSHNNTQTVATGGGAVELTQSAGGALDYGNKFRVTATSAIGLAGSNPSCTSTLGMTLSTHRTSLRFTAQEGKTVNAIRVYLQSEAGTSPSYRYGIQTNNPSGNVPSGTWVGNFGTLTATSTGWKTITLGSAAALNAGSIYHIVIQYNSGTASCSRYVALRQSAPLNSLYPKTNNSDPNANTLFFNGSSWSTIGGQPIYELDFNDAPQTLEGNPYDTSTVVNIFGSNYVGEKFTVAGGNKTVTSISFYLRRQGSPPNDLTVEIRDAGNNPLPGSSGTIATTSSSTTFIYLTYTFGSPIAFTNGSTYSVILRTTNGTSTNRYQVYRIDNTPNLANYNSITYDGTNSVYTSSIDSGGTWVDANNRDIGGYFFTASGTGSYAASGDFTSATLDLGSDAALNNVTWTATVPAGTALSFQVALSGNAGGPFDYFGSDGNIGSYFTTPSAIPLNRVNGQYVRYKVVFTSDGSATPTLSDISFNYSP